jgi:hypothetical protein
MGVTTKVALKIIIFMDMGCIIGITKECMKETGRKIKCMVTEK